MTSFASLADGGRALVSPLRELGLENPLVLAIVPNGVPVAEPVAEALGAPLLGALLDREGEPRLREPLPGITGRTVIVVDDGVETGTAASLVGSAARAAGAAYLVLAVPVCPREARPAMERVYDAVIAVDSPLARRDLRWHYADFDTIDEAEARRRLDSR
ncbi:MAG: phosphoribosyltransferase family protein [Candidatus Nanopelagicales bacterium]